MSIERFLGECLPLSVLQLSGISPRKFSLISELVVLLPLGFAGLPLSVQSLIDALHVPGNILVSLAELKLIPINSLCNCNPLLIIKLVLFLHHSVLLLLLLDLLVEVGPLLGLLSLLALEIIMILALEGCASGDIFSHVCRVVDTLVLVSLSHKFKIL